MKNRQLNTEGCGLGLSISKLIAHALGGDIEFKSVYGEGSTFSMIMPYRDSPETPSSNEHLSFSVIDKERVDTNRSFINKGELSDNSMEK